MTRKVTDQEIEQTAASMLMDDARTFSTRKDIRWDTCPEDVKDAYRELATKQLTGATSDDLANKIYTFLNDHLEDYEEWPQANEGAKQLYRDLVTHLNLTQDTD